MVWEDIIEPLSLLHSVLVAINTCHISSKAKLKNQALAGAQGNTKDPQIRI